MTNTKKDDPIPGDSGPKIVQPLTTEVQSSLTTQDISAIQALLDLGKAIGHIPEKGLLEDSDQSGGSRYLPVPPELITLVELSELVDSPFGEDIFDFFPFHHDTCSIGNPLAQRETPLHKHPRIFPGSKSQNNCQLCQLLSTDGHMPSPLGLDTHERPISRVFEKWENIAENIMNRANSSTGAHGFSIETVTGRKRKNRIDENEYEQGGNAKKNQTAQNGEE